MTTPSPIHVPTKYQDQPAAYRLGAAEAALETAVRGLENAAAGRGEAARAARHCLETLQALGWYAPQK